MWCVRMSVCVFMCVGVRMCCVGCDNGYRASAVCVTSAVCVASAWCVEVLSVCMCVRVDMRMCLVGCDNGYCACICQCMFMCGRAYVLW
jgi:hypothetical protein